MPADLLGGTAIKPVERKGWEAVEWFLYDKNTGAIMGRTPKSWLLITIFYIIYYSCLAAFWALCLFIFFEIAIDNDVPTWTKASGIIGTSPAMGVRPAQHWDKVESSMIIFNQASNKQIDKIPSWKEWSDRTKDFLAPYASVNQTGEDCKGDGKLGQVCKFDLSKLGPCAKDNYGYDKGSPCIFLKLNKIFDLDHDYFNTTARAKEENVPARVIKVMDKIVNDTKEGTNTTTMRQVWVDCHGENPADKEELGDIRYYPATSGFEAKYFPYFNQKGYVSPLVAVQFLNPKAGQLFHIECRAYAGNIKYHKRDKLGRAHFELLVHNAKTMAGPPA